jgi:hypothetical protein
MIPAGRKAQSQPAITAIERPATWFAKQKRGRVAAAEKRMFNKTAAKKLETVNAPKMRKTNDKRKG